MRLLDRLEQRALIERRRHPTDRRIWLLDLSDEARPLMAQMRESGDATRQEALSSLSEADRGQLMEALCEMKTNLAEACTRPVDPKEASHG